MFKLSDTWKYRIARLVRNPLLHRLMVLGIRVTVPRQRIGVAMVALNDQNEVFLLHHVFHGDIPWGLPGGWLDRNEDPQTGVLRELKEETGLTADLGPVVYARHEPNPPHLGIAIYGRIHPNPITLSPEIIDAAWHPVDNRPRLYPFMEKAIAAALPYHRQTAVLPIPIPGSQGETRQ